MGDPKDLICSPLKKWTLFFLKGFTVTFEAKIRKFSRKIQKWDVTFFHFHIYCFLKFLFYCWVGIFCHWKKLQLLKVYFRHTKKSNNAKNAFFFSFDFFSHSGTILNFVFWKITKKKAYMRLTQAKFITLGNPKTSRKFIFGPF